jgi:hypothetical protein
LDVDREKVQEVMWVYWTKKLKAPLIGEWEGLSEGLFLPHTHTMIVEETQLSKS